MEKKIVYTVDMKGSDTVLKEMALLRDENERITKSQKEYIAAVRENKQISIEARKEFEKDALQLKENKKQITELTKAYEGQQQKVTGLRPRLTELRKEMQELANAGKQNSQVYKDMRKEAGNLQDQIDKTSAEIKYFSDDLSGLKSGVATLGAVSAGFQAVTGIMAIAGVESEKFEKMLLKVQGAMAVSNALQQVGNALRKEGAVRMGISIVLMKAKAAALWVLNGGFLAAVGATKLFSAAIFQIPLIGWLLKAIALIGTLVGLIYGAIKALKFWKKDTEEIIEATDGLTEAEKRLAESLQRVNSEIEKRNRLASATVTSLENEIKLMKAQGKSLDEIAVKERELVVAKVEQAKAAYEALLMNNDATAIQKENAKQAVRNAQLEIQIFDETEKTKTRIAQEEAAKRLAEKREVDMQNELQYLNDLNAQYLSADAELEEQRRMMRLENYERRKAEQAQERADRQAITMEYNSYLEQQRQSELTNFQLRAEQYKAWLDKKGITQTQYNDLMKRHGEDLRRHEEQMQLARVASSLMATGQLVSNLGNLMGAGTKAAKFMQGLALAEAFVSLKLGIAKTIATSGLPLATPFLIAIAAQSVGILAGIKNMMMPTPPKFAKGGVIGGQSHAAGGTTFHGSDGSVFEAEKGEYLAIVNKYDASRAAMLDAVNQKHGVSFGKTSGYFARGGVMMPNPRTDFERTNTDDIIRETMNAIGMIPVVVAEKDMTDTQRRVTVYEGEGNL